MQRLELTRRQTKVLHWIAEGKTNDEISVILGCSFFTVKNHLKKIFQRLGVHSRTAAATCAYRAHIHDAADAAVSSLESRRSPACTAACAGAVARKPPGPLKKQA